MSNFSQLANMGWQPFFQQQLTLEEWETLSPARIVEQHKSDIVLAGDFAQISHPLLHSMPDLVVGDWLLLDSHQHFIRLLERKTCFVRKAAGTKVHTQRIAANVDTAFILCSINEDFNLNRIERFLAVVNDAGAEPVVLLSKSDLADDPAAFKARVQALDEMLAVETLNCLDSGDMQKLSPWLKAGNTLAVLGSSGVGKSTLVNTLLGEPLQSTAAIREDDAKGRHTTTRRSLIATAGGSLLLDTPGMREIQLADCSEGIASTFADIERLGESCRFGDCQHQNEPGCAVKNAVEQGTLDQRRLDNYLKLRREDAFNSASLSEKRARDKALGKFYRRTMVDVNAFKGR